MATASSASSTVDSARQTASRLCPPHRPPTTADLRRRAPCSQQPRRSTRSQRQRPPSLRPPCRADGLPLRRPELRRTGRDGGPEQPRGADSPPFSSGIENMETLRIQRLAGSSEPDVPSALTVESEVHAARRPASQRRLSSRCARSSPGRLRARARVRTAKTRSSTTRSTPRRNRITMVLEDGAWKLVSRAGRSGLERADRRARPSEHGLSSGARCVLA